MGLNAEMNTMMQERFNVSGALLVKLFGRPAEEQSAFDSRAAGVRDIGIKQATYQRMYFVGLSLTAALATAFAYGYGGRGRGPRDDVARHRRRRSRCTWPGYSRR